jgi:hypothetical protein
MDFGNPVFETFAVAIPELATNLLVAAGIAPLKFVQVRIEDRPFRRVERCCDRRTA